MFTSTSSGRHRSSFMQAAINMQGTHMKHRTVSNSTTHSFSVYFCSLRFALESLIPLYLYLSLYFIHSCFHLSCFHFHILSPIRSSTLSLFHSHQHSVSFTYPVALFSRFHSFPLSLRFLCLFYF